MRIGRDDRVGIVAGCLVVFLVVVRTLHDAITAVVVLIRTKRIATGSQCDTCYHSLCKLLRTALYRNTASRRHLDGCGLQVGNDCILNGLTVGNRNDIFLALGGRCKGEWNVTKHHYEVMINHGTQTLGLTNPL